MINRRDHVEASSARKYAQRLLRRSVAQLTAVDAVNEQVHMLIGELGGVRAQEFRQEFGLINL